MVVGERLRHVGLGRPWIALYVGRFIEGIGVRGRVRRRVGVRIGRRVGG